MSSTPPPPLSLPTHSGRVSTVRFHSPQSPAFAYLLTGGADSTIRLWNAMRESPRTAGAALELHAFKGGHPNGSEILDAALEETAELMVSVSDARPVVLWDTTSGECLTRFHGHEARVNTCVFKPKGIIVTGSNDCTVRVWDVRGKNQIAMLPRFSHAVTSVCMYESYIIVASYGAVSTFDVRMGKTTIDSSPQQHGYVTLSRDGKFILVSRLSSHHASIHCLERSTGKTLQVLRGHKNQELACRICVSDVGDRVFAGSEDGLLRSWSVITSSTTSSTQAAVAAVTPIIHTTVGNRHDAILAVDHHPSTGLLAYSRVGGGGGAGGTMVMRS